MNRKRASEGGSGAGNPCSFRFFGKLRKTPDYVPEEVDFQSLFLTDASSELKFYINYCSFQYNVVQNAPRNIKNSISDMSRTWNLHNFSFNGFM